MTRLTEAQQIESSVLQCLLLQYGVEGSLSRLPGENLNFLVSCSGGERYVFKIVDDDMPPDVVEMENEVIEHVSSRGFSCQLPKIIKNKNNKIETGIQLRNIKADRCRLLTFVEGIQLDSMPDISISSRKNLGETLARFDSCLKSFDHPAAHRNHRWNLADAIQHRAKLALFDDRKQLDLLRWAFDFWNMGARSRLASLPHQVIHGDAHGENVLMKGEQVIGLVDFGDCCFNPTICELGVSLPYMMMDQDDPIQLARDIIAGYHSVSPVSPEELEVLLPLICGRLAVTLCVAEQRSQIDPGHPNWFVSSSDAFALLEFLAQYGPEPAKSLFL